MWIISYRWNDKAYIESYKYFDKASERVAQLTSSGHNPSIHFKEVTH